MHDLLFRNRVLYLSSEGGRTKLTCKKSSKKLSNLPIAQEKILTSCKAWVLATGHSWGSFLRQSIIYSNWIDFSKFLDKDFDSRPECSQKFWKTNENSSASCNIASVLFLPLTFYFEIVIDSYGLEKLLQIHPYFTQLPSLVTSCKTMVKYHNQDIHSDTVYWASLDFPRCVCLFLWNVITCVGWHGTCSTDPFFRSSLFSHSNHQLGSLS